MEWKFAIVRPFHLMTAMTAQKTMTISVVSNEVRWRFICKTQVVLCCRRRCSRRSLRLAFWNGIYRRSPISMAAIVFKYLPIFGLRFLLRISWCVNIFLLISRSLDGVSYLDWNKVFSCLWMRNLFCHLWLIVSPRSSPGWISSSQWLIKLTVAAID